MTPDELARELGINPKTLRAWLRRSGARPVAEHGQRWLLDRRLIDAAKAHYGDRPAGRRFTAPGLMAEGRNNRDEGYIIDLCDEILGEPARRQHCFPWLVGDPARSGSRRALPVDAYYEGHDLVVEYQERQHFVPTPFFDRRQTVSGVGRGEQRRLYDERRETEIPAHGLRLVVVTPGDVDADRQGRLRRNAVHDRAALKKLLGTAPVAP